MTKTGTNMSFKIVNMISKLSEISTLSESFSIQYFIAKMCFYKAGTETKIKKIDLSIFTQIISH